jgi:hypothetical protein
MKESFSGFKSPTVIAAGRILGLTGTVAGTPNWAGIVPTALTGVHPGFAAAITDGGVGVYTVTINAALTGYTAVIIATSETTSLFVSAVRTGANTFRLDIMNNAGAAADADVSLMVLCV